MQNGLTYEEGLASNGIYYRIYGKSNPGAPIAMVMGYGGCMFAWPLGFVHRLAQRSKVIIFDNRGTGRSEPLPEGIDLRIHDFSQDLHDLLDCLEFNEAEVFGYSLGGCVALDFSHLFPTRVKHLILQSTMSGGALYTGPDQEVRERLANPRGNNFDEMLFDFFDLCMSKDSLNTHRDTLNRICENARPYPTSPRVLQAQLRAIRQFDASAYLSSLTAKTLLFHGLADRIIKVQNGQRLAENLPDCQSEFLDTCGHCPHIEHEDVIVETIATFIS